MGQSEMSQPDRTSAERLLAEAIAGRSAGADGGASNGGAGTSDGAQASDGAGASDGARASDGAGKRAGDELPPAGFQPFGGDDPGERWLQSLSELARALGELIPPELQRRLTEALRELLVALRALVEHCIDALERRSRRPAPIRDIPIL